MKVYFCDFHFSGVSLNRILETSSCINPLIIFRVNIILTRIRKTIWGMIENSMAQLGIIPLRFSRLNIKKKKKINAKFWIKLHKCVKVFTWPFWKKERLSEPDLRPLEHLI